MWMLAGGLLLFFAIHLIPTRPALRAQLVGSVGRGPYLALFGLTALAALALIVLGYGQMQGLGRGNPQVWIPPTWTRHLTMLLMLPALILLVAALLPNRIRTAVGHPMLAALALWAVAHLVANGDLASVLLFGSFLAFAVYDLVSARQRGALGPLGAAGGGPAQDAIAVAGGLALYALLLFGGHGWLTGVPLMP
jgi:uncharacterized membrane protein